MNISEIEAQLAAATDTAEVVRLALLGLATTARDRYPFAMYVYLGVTDQDTSGALFTAAAFDAYKTPLPDSDLDEDDFAWRLDDSNRSEWLPYMTPDPNEGRYHRGEYLLIIDKVLTELTLTRPTRTTLTEFAADYQRWLTHRQELSARETDGDFPKAGDWEGSDDTARDLLEEAVSLLDTLLAAMGLDCPIAPNTNERENTDA